MGILNIRRAKRAGARLVIGMSGISGSGKTFTAIQFAYGLAGYNSEKVGLLDTENKRGSLYADILENEAGEVQEFMIGDLFAPFSPQRHIDAILEFQAAGVEVLVIDTTSHEWEGIGGCHDIAKPPGVNLKIDRWNDAKAEHKRFMNVLLSSSMHVIVCIRARNKVEIGKDSSGKTMYINKGVIPVQEPNFMFEMTASMLMWDEGKIQDVLKCPKALRPMLGRGIDYITAADGFAVRDWVNGADVKLNPLVEKWRGTLRTETEKGEEAVKVLWKTAPARVQKILDKDGTLNELRASAFAFDKARVQGQAGGEELDDLNKELLGTTT